MKKNIAALVIIFVVMFLCPWAAVTFVPGDAGMAVCFILFFGVNPLCSLYVGVFSGLSVKKRWFLPLVNAASFLLGVWAVFDWGNRNFCGYTIAYLAIALVAMLAGIVLRSIRKNK